MTGYLATYLNDHLAGSVAALQLLERLEREQPHTELGVLSARLRKEVECDRADLDRLMRHLEISTSTPRRVAAWFAEKVATFKLHLDDSPDGPLHALEALEALSLGLEGKRLLWRSLGATADEWPDLKILDYSHLEQRAAEQRQWVEISRLLAARQALTAR